MLQFLYCVDIIVEHFDVEIVILLELSTFRPFNDLRRNVVAIVIEHKFPK
jgi:hypothetical protein